MLKWDIGNGSWYWADTFDAMAQLPDGSVDMILCDLPYGTTEKRGNKWDVVIPFEQLWAEYWRICKPNAAVVLTAAQPFTSALVMSQLKRFRYDWSWNKTHVTGHLNAKRRPMRNHEDILVFGSTDIPYIPQGIVDYNKITTRGRHGSNFNQNIGAKKENLQTHTNYPRSRIEFSNDGKIHPTQKPVALFEYLIKTYTNPGDLVLDNCSGSGTTAIAAEQSSRRWICVEQDLEYSMKARERIERHLADQACA